MEKKDKSKDFSELDQGQTGALNLNPKQVLWVDDDEVVRDIGELFMRQLGYLVDTASSGREALELLACNRYKLLITDIGMPGISGLQLAKMIKGKYVGMQVAIITGLGSNALGKEKEECGINYVLGKPMSITELQSLTDDAFQ